MAVLIHSRKHVEVHSYFLYVTPTFLYYYFLLLFFFSCMLQVAQVAAYKLNCPLEMIAIKPTAAFTNPNSKYNNDKLTLTLQDLT